MEDIVTQKEREREREKGDEGGKEDRKRGGNCLIGGWEGASSERRERERRGWIDRGARGERGEVEEIMREREERGKMRTKRVES